MSDWLPRPEPKEGFDADQMGESLRGVTLGVRLAGFAIVTPFLEELFVRSWMIRAANLVSIRRSADSWKPELHVDFDRDFREYSVGQYTRWSFWITVVYFTLSHATWEWPVALATGILWNLYLYYRGHIAPLILVHAVTNLSLFLAVVLGPEVAARIACTVMAMAQFLVVALLVIWGQLWHAAAVAAAVEGSERP